MLILGLLCGPTSSSRRGLQPWSVVFFAFRAKTDHAVCAYFPPAMHAYIYLLRRAFFNFFVVVFFALEDTAHYAGLLLALAEGFGQGVLPFGQVWTDGRTKILVSYALCLIWSKNPRILKNKLFFF